MKVIRYRMCILLLAAALLASCSDSPAPLVGKWNFIDAKGYGFEGVMEFRADGTGTYNDKGKAVTNLVWEHLDGQTPEGYQNAVQISAVIDGKATGQIKCGYKVELDSLSFGKCKDLEDRRFTRAPQ